jgi:hypothetical protein
LRDILWDKERKSVSTLDVLPELFETKNPHEVVVV